MITLLCFALALQGCLLTGMATNMLVKLDFEEPVSVAIAPDGSEVLLLVEGIDPTSALRSKVPCTVRIEPTELIESEIVNSPDRSRLDWSRLTDNIGRVSIEQDWVTPKADYRIFNHGEPIPFEVDGEVVPIGFGPSSFSVQVIRTGGYYHWLTPFAMLGDLVLLPIFAVAAVPILGLTILLTPIWYYEVLSNPSSKPKPSDAFNAHFPPNSQPPDDSNALPEPQV